MGPANVVGLLSLPPSSALSSASNQTDCRIPQVGFPPPVFVRAFPPPPVFFLSFRYLLPQHLHQKADRIDTKLAVPSECSLCHLLYLSIYDSVWRLPVCLLFQFMGYHFLGWTGSPSSCNSSVCHNTFAHSYWEMNEEWENQKLWYSATCGTKGRVCNCNLVFCFLSSIDTFHFSEHLEIAQVCFVSFFIFN